MIEYIMIFLASVVGLLLAVRLTEKPLRIGFSVTETAANAFTTVAINMPTIPSIALARGSDDVMTIGAEIMSVRTEIRYPDVETGQANTVTYELVKGPTPTAFLGLNDQRVIDRQLLRAQTIATAAGETLLLDKEVTAPVDMSDHDGNGEIVADNEIHASIQGGGNANVRSVNGYLLYHVVQLSGNEALFELIETNQ